MFNILFRLKQTLIGIQFLFVAFSAIVIVPLLIGMDPTTALLCAGVGTLIFHLITKGQVPIFLGSSFAFIAPIIASSKLYGLPATMSGIVAVGLVYILIGSIVRWKGIKIIQKLFPPIVIGPIIMLIGLSLAPNAVNMAKENWLIASVSLATSILFLVYGKGMVKLLPILAGIVVGYIFSLFLIDIDFTPLAEAAWFELPNLVQIEFSLEAILFMLPIAIAPIIEHIGDIYTICSVAEKDFVKKPGLHRTMIGDGVACMFSGFIGGPPVTTYSEVTGAVSLTKMTNPMILRISAIAAIIFSLIGKTSALLKSIPSPVLGGIMLLLFGTIASVGVGNMIQNKVDMSKTRNIIIASIILTTGLGGAVLSIGSFSLAGIGLASVVGVFLNLILPDKK